MIDLIRDACSNCCRCFLILWKIFCFNTVTKQKATVAMPGDTGWLTDCRYLTKKLLANSVPCSIRQEMIKYNKIILCKITMGKGNDNQELSIK